MSNFTTAISGTAGTGSAGGNKTGGSSQSEIGALSGQRQRQWGSSWAQFGNEAGQQVAGSLVGALGDRIGGAVRGNAPDSSAPTLPAGSGQYATGSLQPSGGIPIVPIALAGVGVLAIVLMTRK